MSKTFRRTQLPLIFSSTDPTDEGCNRRPDCDMCWKICEKLRTDSKSWKYVCDSDDTFICPSGCRAACNFVQRNNENVKESSVSKWTFPRQPETEAIGHTQLIFNWQKPRPVKDAKLTDYIVYTLFWRDGRTDRWKYLCTSASLHALMDGPHYLYKQIQFRLMAVSDYGLLAVTSPAYPPDGYTPPEEEKVTEAPYENYADYYEVEQPQSAKPVHPQPTHNYEPRQTIQIGLDVHLQSSEDGVQAIISWKQPVSFRPSSYLVRWGRDSCSFDPAFVGCDTNYRQEYSASMRAGREKSFRLSIASLTYNSKYWVEISIDSVNTRRIYFYTPGCKRPDEMFTRCQHNLTTEFLSSSATSEMPKVDVGQAVEWTVYVNLTVGGVIGVITLVFIVIIIIRNHQRLLQLLIAKAALVRMRISFRRLFRCEVNKSSTENSGTSTSICDLRTISVDGSSSKKDLMVSCSLKSSSGYPSSNIINVQNPTSSLSHQNLHKTLKAMTAGKRSSWPLLPSQSTIVNVRMVSSQSVQMLPVTEDVTCKDNRTKNALMTSDMCYVIDNNDKGHTVPLGEECTDV